jgi:FkbM family methyltransferase
MMIKEFRNLKVCYREGTVDEHVLGHSFEDGIYFIPEYIPTPEDNIIDIGAHIGTFSILAASKLRRGKVYAIEACQETFEYLRRNVALNQLSNVSLHHLALTDFKGTVRLFYDINSGNWGHSIVKELSDQYEDVCADTLTNFMADNNITRCDFMKFNCEGAEFKIILSTPREILQRVKVMLILYHLDLVREHSEANLMSYLQQCGFSTTARHRGFGGGEIIATNNYLYHVSSYELKKRFIHYYLRCYRYYLHFYLKDFKNKKKLFH